MSVDVERAGVEMCNGRQPRARGGALICGTETGTVQPLRLPDIPSGHIVMSSFVCVL